MIESLSTTKSVLALRNIYKLVLLYIIALTVTCRWILNCFIAEVSWWLLTNVTPQCLQMHEGGVWEIERNIELLWTWCTVLSMFSLDIWSISKNILPWLFHVVINTCLTIIIIITVLVYNNNNNFILYCANSVYIILKNASQSIN